MSRGIASLRASLLLALCGVSSGCVAVGWGTYPEPSTPGVEKVDDTSVKVTTADVSATIKLRTYQPTLMLWGLLVPVIPFPWFIGTRERLEVAISVTDGSSVGITDPRSLRILLDSHEYAATSLECDGYLAAENFKHVELPCDQPVRHGSIRYDFMYLPSPREFSLAVQGLPRIDFHPKTRWFHEAWND